MLPKTSPSPAVLAALTALSVCACGQAEFTWPSPPAVAAAYQDIIPLRAGHLEAADNDLWTALDPVGRRSQIQAALARLKALGARQVIVDAPFAFTTEPSVDKAYDGYANYNVIYDSTASLTAALSACQRSDMGPAPYAVPQAWAALPQAQQQANANAALTGILQLARGAGLIPVLFLRNHAVPASPAECKVCVSDADCADPALPDGAVTCTYTQLSDATGVCRAPLGDVPYLDPSRNFNAFFTAYQSYVVSMAQVAVQGGAALLVIGGGSPYLSGGGQATFADNTAMSDRRAQLTSSWTSLISTVRTALTQGVPAGQRAPLLSYSALNAFQEPRPIRDAAQGNNQQAEWALVNFFGALDAVGVEFYQPGRGSNGAGVADTSNLQMPDMLTYMETHGYATSNVGSIADLETLGHARGYSVTSRPILLLSDGIPALQYAAAQPDQLPPTPGVSPDFTEQQTFLAARLLLIGEAQERGVIGGVGLRLFQANILSSGQPSFGGEQKALTPGQGFNTLADYVGLFATPAEQTIGAAWSPAIRTGP